MVCRPKPASWERQWRRPRAKDSGVEKLSAHCSIRRSISSRREGFFYLNGIGRHPRSGENEVALVGDGPLNIFALGKIHSLGDGGRKVDVPLLAFLALNELHFCWITHNALY